MACYGAALMDVFVDDTISFEAVEKAAKAIDVIKKSGEVIMAALNPENCNLSPVFRVQNDIQDKVDIDVKGAKIDECRSYQKSGETLSLLNIICPPRLLKDMPTDYFNNGKWECFPPFSKDRRFLMNALRRSSFSLVCKTDIKQVKAQDEPSLGYMTISLSGNANDSIPVRVRFHEFTTQLPDEDGYMVDRWDLTVDEIYILYTNYKKTYEPHVKELEARLKKFRDDTTKRIKLGEISSEEAKAKILEFAHNEAEVFAEHVANGTFERDFQDKAKKAIEERTAKEDDEAKERILSKNFEFKVYASKTLVANGISVEMLGDNAEVWKDIQGAYSKKDWRSICRVLETRSGGRWMETGEWTYHIRKAAENLDSFNPTFGIKVNGEGITKSCCVIAFGRGNNFYLPQYNNTMDEMCREDGSGLWRIQHQPFRDGDFAIVHIDDMKGFADDASKEYEMLEKDLKEKLRAGEITKQQYEVMWGNGYQKIKLNFIKKCNLQPIKLNLGK